MKKKIQKLDLVFACYKCEHNLFIENGARMFGEAIAKKLKTSCPNCGEEPDDWTGLWSFVRLGNFDKEHPTN